MRPRPRRAAATLPFLLLVAACAVNPATGERQLSLVSEGQEIEMGREAHPQILQSMGTVDNPELQEYVSRLGQELAATSERPDLPWAFTVIDDPTVNAFAVPGGFIYVTRGILAHFDSEAELAGVLGHEIGHITARHSVNQMSRQQLQQIGLGVGMVLSEDVRQFGDVLAAGLGLLNLRYSRGDESQSDELGVRYMTRSGYDPDALIGVFDMLASVSGGEGGRVPQWQLTHPYPENRAEDIREYIAQNPATEAATEVDRAEYLARLEGMVYGTDPREGYFQGERFLHPDLTFELTFPPGWQTVNQRTVVGAISPDQDAVVSLQLASDVQDPTTALRAFLAQDGISGGQIRATSENGVPGARALFEARTQQGTLRGEALFLRYDGNVYQLLGYAPAARWSARSGSVAATLSSFAPLTEPRLLDVEPRRLEIMRLPASMTLREFHEEHSSAAPLEEVARINRAEPDERLPTGRLMKRVVGELPPGSGG